MNQSFLKVCTPLMGNMIHTLLITLPSTLSPWPPSLISRGTLHFPLHLDYLDNSNKTAIECQPFEHHSILKRIESLATKIFFSLPYKTKVTRQKIATSLDGNHLLQISSHLPLMDLLVVTLAKPLLVDLLETIEGHGLAAELWGLQDGLTLANNLKFTSSIQSSHLTVP